MHLPPAHHRFFRRLPSRFVALTLAFAAFLPAASAHAAEADALVKEAKKLVAAKKYDEACPKFAEAYAQSSNVATLVDLALCHEKQGKLATAWSELLDAEAAARKAGRSDIETRARGNSKALEAKLPRISVTIASPPPGLEVTIDGQKIDTSAQGKGRPVDPGEHKIVASAPQRKPFETTVTVKQGQLKAVPIPALAEDASAAPPKGPDKPDPTTDKGPDKTPPTDAPKDGSQTTNPPTDKPNDSKGPVHRAKRIVVDVGISVGGQLFLGGGSLPALSNLTYEYHITDAAGFDATNLEVCDSSKCRAITDPAIGVSVGGQAFVGFAVNEKLHIGGRFYGNFMPTGGYSLLVGPSLSMQVGERLWVGGTVVVGWGAQNAPIVGAMGVVPSEWVAKNQGQDEVKVILDRTIPAEDDVGFGFSFGASAEVSYRLAEFGKGQSLMTGSLLASAWPTFLKTSDGFHIALPIGVGYRFH